MKLQLIQKKKLLGTSTNQGELFNKTYKVGDISFKLGEMKFYTRSTEADISNLIANELINPRITSFGDYQSEEGLELYSKKDDNKILIVSAGEINRGVFNIYVEGVWNILRNQL